MSLKLAAALLIGVLLTQGRAAAQSTNDAEKEPGLAQKKLEDVSIKAQGVVGLLSGLAFMYDIPVGVEVAQDEDRPAAVIIDFDSQGSDSIDFKKGTLAELLTQFVAEHKRYAWKIENGVVSVFPTEGHRDPALRELLETEIGGLAVKSKTSCYEFARSLLNAPEVRKTLEGHGLAPDPGRFGGFYIQQLGQNFTLAARNESVKSILDRVVKASPTARFWAVSTDRPRQTLWLHVPANFEDPSAPAGGSKTSGPSIILPPLNLDKGPARE